MLEFVLVCFTSLLTFADIGKVHLLRQFIIQFAAHPIEKIQAKTNPMQVWVTLVLIYMYMYL